MYNFTFQRTEELRQLKF